MARRVPESIDYRVAQAIEVVTRESTENEEASHALRNYAKYMKTGERNLYKLINRAVNLGFRFGISIRYERLSMARILALVDGELDLPLPVEGVYTSMDGRRVYDLLVHGSCLDEVLARVEAAGGEYYVVSTEWGSRPALATVRYLYLSPDDDVDEHVVEEMGRLLRELLARGPPSNISGRRYPLDKTLLAIIAATRRRAVTESIAKVARDLGIPHAKAQRKYYNLWSRRVILGYSVVEAPYFRRDKVIAEISYNDPLRMAYAAAVLPPVVYGLVASPGPGRRQDKVLLVLSGPGSLITRTLGVIRRNWGRIDRLIFYHEDSIDRDYPKKILAIPGQLPRC